MPKGFKGFQKKELNNMWKGDDIKYISLHDWIRRNKPKTQFCECCKLVHPYDLANISGEYKRDINDFEWLCRECHMTKDGRKNMLIERNKTYEYNRVVTEKTRELMKEISKNRLRDSSGQFIKR